MKRRSVVAEIARILLEFEVELQKAAAEGEDSEAHALATASTQATKKAARKVESNSLARRRQIGKGRK